MAIRVQSRAVVGAGVIPELLPGPGREPERVYLVADAPPPGASPRFPGAAGRLAHHWVLRGPDAATQAERLLASGRAETAARALRAAPPPDDDLPPETPAFPQAWRGVEPEGLGFDEGAQFPGSSGEYVTIVDVEFDWDPAHEDLLHSAARLGGEPDPTWQFHGSGVLGILAAGDNGFGVVGGAPGAAVLVEHPYFANDTGLLEYDPARAIVEAAAVLSPGDVILVEQQAYGPDFEFVPISIDAGVRDAIRAATAAGIVVVEPAGNDAVDLDDPVYEGAFTDETGVLRVGGGEPSTGDLPGARDGSNWGSSVVVQGWSAGIVTVGGPPYTDLWYPDADPRQAYTAQFGGTSGASAMVAAAVAVVQSTAIASRGAPLAPAEVEALLVEAGWPAPAGSEPVGALPDLRRVLRGWLVP